MDRITQLCNQERITLGKSAGGREISLQRFGSGSLPILLLGGVHGNESEGFFLIERYVDALINKKIELSEKISLFVCERLNPDGCEVLRRTNDRNVDLNRNLSTKDWTREFTDVKYYPGPMPASEPESKLCIEMIQSIEPAMILSLHSYKHAMINYNGPCRELAEAMSAENRLPPKGDIGYPTPGSLGTWAGWERKIPTLTLEILRGQEPDLVWQTHSKGLSIAIEYYLTHPRPKSTYT